MIIKLLLERCRRLCAERCAEAKARIVRVAATAVSRTAAFIVASLLIAIGAIFLGGSLTLLFAAWIGSLAGGMAITGAIAIICGLIIWSCRARFMHRAAVRGILNALEKKKL